MFALVFSFTLNSKENQRTLTQYGTIIESMDALFEKENITFSVAEDSLPYRYISSCKINSNAFKKKITIIVNTFQWNNISTKDQNIILSHHMQACANPYKKQT